MSDALIVFRCLCLDIMMLPTHALVGMALALPLALVAPEYAVIALSAGFLGGVFPDLDMYLGHRKTLHYPVYFSVLAVGVGAIAITMPTPVTVGSAVFLAAAAVHSVMDIFGGGLELRPWEASSDRAVYDHYTGRWIAPRRWIRYDGAPEDLGLSVVLAGPLALTVDGVFRWLIFVSLVVAISYASVRRVLPVLAVTVVSILTDRLPSWLHSYIPARYVGASRDSSV